MSDYRPDIAPAGRGIAKRRAAPECGPKHLTTECLEAKASAQLDGSRQPELTGSLTFQVAESSRSVKRHADRIELLRMVHDVGKDALECCQSRRARKVVANPSPAK
jgi:hypothetical protein